MKVTNVNEVQLRKHKVGNDWIVDGKCISFNDEHDAKHLSPIEISYDDNWIWLNDVHLWKHSFPSDVTLSGIIIDSNKP